MSFITPSKDGYSLVPTNDPNETTANIQPQIDTKDEAANAQQTGSLKTEDGKTHTVSKETKESFCAKWGIRLLAVIGALLFFWIVIPVAIYRSCCIDKTLKTACNTMKTTEEGMKLQSFCKIVENKKYNRTEINDERSFGEVLTQHMDPNDAPQLAPHLDKIKKLANTPNPENPDVINNQILTELRAAINSDAYQKYKTDPSHSAIDFIQMMALSIYRTEALDSYHRLGVEIMTQTQQHQADSKAHKEADTKHQESGMIGPRIAEQLETSHLVCTQKLYTDQGAGKIVYGVTHPEQALASASSEGGGLRTVAKALGGSDYDSASLQLANNPSLQGTMTWKQNGKAVTLQNVYGGTPTIGDKTIFPELHAVLDAITNNNNKLQPETQNPDIPHRFIYTNFQDINKKTGEGPRSATIMKLAKVYPGAFQAITLPKDSSFYKSACLMPSAEKLAEIAKHPDTLAYHFQFEPLSIKQFGEEMRRRMLNDVSFKIDGRTPPKEEDSGFYFSRNNPNETIVQCKDRWNKTLTAITENANEFFAEAEKHAKEPAEKAALRAAYMEYVYSMIQGYFEADTAQQLSKMETAPRIMAIRACKENIDRGGAENVKYMYTRMDHAALQKSGKQPDELLMGALHSRALSTRDRVIIEHRIEALMAFIRHVEPDDFRHQQSVIFQKLKMPITNYHFTPKIEGTEIPKLEEILRDAPKVPETDRAKMHRERNEIRRKMGMVSLKPGYATSIDLERLRKTTATKTMKPSTLSTIPEAPEKSSKA